ncbi:MAG: alpha/beta hydrolase [Rhizobiaceae bacterium]
MLKKTLIFLIILTVAACILFAVGPRVEVDTTVTFDEASIGDDVDAYLAEREAKFGDLRNGLQKEVIWAYPASKAKTPLSIVYVHGFSSSKGETRPFADLIAHELGANLFYNRLTGHGRTEDAMAEGSVNAWVNDLAEAVAIGRKIGEKVIIIATSTGGGLSAWGTTEPPLLDDVAALVLISPLFRINDPNYWMLTLPWAEQLAVMFEGEYRSFEPRNELQKHINTYRYPTKALLPVSAIAALAYAAPYEKVDIPVLFLISDDDSVVRPDLTREIAQKWGGHWEIIPVEDSESESQHVIVGDASSPSTTAKLSAKTIEWLKENLK